MQHCWKLQHLDESPIKANGNDSVNVAAYGQLIDVNTQIQKSSLQTRDQKWEDMR